MATKPAAAAASLRSRIVDTGTIDPSELIANPRNWRTHPPEQRAALEAELDRVGWVQGVMVNRTTGHLVDGHLRADVAAARGWSEIPVTWVELTQEEEDRVLVSLDPLGSMATTNAEMLDALLASMDLDNRGLEQHLVSFLAGLNKPGMGDEDAIPEPPDEPTTRRGDLWILGDHRLLCGDSGSPDDLDRLMAGERVHLLATDPPYNVKVEPRSNNAIAAGLSSFSAAAQTHHQALDLARHPEKSKPTGKMRAKDRPLENDFVTDEAFEAMLKAWFGNAARVMIPGGGFYIWGGYANVANYPPALKEAGLYFSQAIIWDKEHPVLTRKDFMGAHEWCFYGWREGGAHRWFGPSNATDLWHVKKVSPNAMVHLTEKPVELGRLCMEYSSQPGEIVLDLFGGSGSTLIAAEQNNRRARLMELDPAYCDVIVNRWQTFTGREATRG